jgi:two-component system chemotaxis response regulator CheY
MDKILIIDDEIKLRETICELLLFLGYDVLEAKDGKDGLEKINQFKPDLILCDIMMPLLDGYGFMEIHNLSDYSNIPVIFLSAKVDSRDQEKILALGVKEIFIKPFVIKELQKRIEYYLLPENRLQ